VYCLYTLAVNTNLYNIIEIVFLQTNIYNNDRKLGIIIIYILDHLLPGIIIIDIRNIDSHSDHTEVLSRLNGHVQPQTTRVRTRTQVIPVDPVSGPQFSGWTVKEELCRVVLFEESKLQRSEDLRWVYVRQVGVLVDVTDVGSDVDLFFD